MLQLLRQGQNRKLEDNIKNEANDELEIISMKYQKEISLLQSRLRETTDELEKINRSKEHMQEQLKNAFMRGLCAMNLEAMNVLQPGNSEKNPEELVGLANNMSKNITHMDEAIANYNATDLISQGKHLPRIQEDIYAQRREDYKVVDQIRQPQINISNGRPLQSDMSDSNRFSKIGGSTQFPNQDLYSRLQTNSSQFRTELSDVESLDKKQLSNVYASLIRENLSDSRIAKDGGNGRSNEKQGGVVILQNPLAESKEHLWRQAPIIGHNRSEEDDSIEELPQAVTFQQSKPAPILKNSNYSSSTRQHTEITEEEGKVLRFDPLASMNSRGLVSEPKRHENKKTAGKSIQNSARKPKFSSKFQ